MLEAHLGVDPSTGPVVRLDVSSHQLANLDLAVAALVADHGGGQLVGIGGGDQRHHQTFGDMLASPRGVGNSARSGGPGAVDTGPTSSCEAVAMGVHLFRYDGRPVAVLQRAANRQYDNACRLEVVVAGDVSEALLAQVRRLMVERSVFRPGPRLNRLSLPAVPRVSLQAG